MAKILHIVKELKLQGKLKPQSIWGIQSRPTAEDEVYLTDSDEE